jgi:F plasmid transfer operon, TraF, protein
MITRCQPIVLAVAMAGWASAAGAQTFETVGTRAAGMGGAFVAVADDSSATYWNPAGFAAGNYFTMVLDRSTAKVNPGGSAGAASGSGLLVSLGMPALGLSYYRLRSTILTPAARLATAAAPDGRKAIGADEVRLDTLITHHSGATLVQSITSGVAVGATLKVVRGVASSTVVGDGDRDALLGDASELSGKGSSKFDADIGVMASRGRLKAGITVRNLTQPEFVTAGETGSLSLQRQTRAGVAVTIREGWVLAADFDLNRTHSSLGDARSFAAGSEGRLGRKAFIRGGLRLNTAGPRQPLLAAGGSYAVMGSILVDAQVTAGSDRAQRGWGLAARFVY